MLNIAIPSAGALFASLLFGTIGLAAFVYGKKTVQWQTICLGVALMAYPYFVDRLWLLYGIGVALCVALYFFRD